MANQFLNRSYQTGVPSYSMDDLSRMLGGLFGPGQMPAQSPGQAYGSDVSPQASGMMTGGQSQNGVNSPIYGPNVSPQAGGQPQSGGMLSGMDPQQIAMILQSLSGMFGR